MTTGSSRWACRRLYYHADSPVAGMLPALPADLDRTVLAPRSEIPRERGVLLVDGQPDRLAWATDLARRHPHLAVVVLMAPRRALPVPADGVRLYLPLDLPVPFLAHALETIFAQLELQDEQARTASELARMREEFETLNAIGIRLSAERDTETLLELILAKAREITRSDAGSLYLIEHDRGVPYLAFKLVQNDSLAAPFQGATLPMTHASVAGYVALTGEAVNLDDAYTPPPGSPFAIDRTYDERAGYRSKSMLVVPMKNPKDQNIGVLQLINCKPEWGERFRSPREIEEKAQAFSPRFQELALSLASQAAVALEKSRLYEELRLALAELEESHERIVQSERLRAIGEMAGGVAHEFNNTLAVILGRTQLLQEDTEDARLQRQLRIIEEAALEGAHTVRRIQEFASVRRSRPFQSLDLNEVVQAAVETARSRWRDAAQAQGIVYDVHVEAVVLPAVTGDALELREALTNLIFNALDAMPDGGRLTLRTSVRDDHVLCAVSDTGLGMTEEVRRHAFEPFFSTKDVKGRGLGLSVAYGIVSRHGGDIEARSRPGQGSTFTIRLPVAGAAVAPLADIATQPTASALRVLVVDDEPQVRRIMVHVLTREGHEVVDCADGPAAVAHLERHRFDLVITDLSMPGLSGLEVAKHVKTFHPGTGVILVTGWGVQFDASDEPPDGVDVVVNKPFQRRELIAAVAPFATHRPR